MDELVKRLRAQAVYLPEKFSKNAELLDVLMKAADAIEELQKAVMRLEDESGILDELPMVDQSAPCDTCVHKGNVDFDYCHICNNEANMYKPQPPKRGMSMNCEYCHEDRDGYIVPLGKNCHAWLKYPNLLVIKLGKERRECVIRYCPMCGREL